MPPRPVYLDLRPGKAETSAVDVNRVHVVVCERPVVVTAEQDVEVNDLRSKLGRAIHRRSRRFHAKHGGTVPAEVDRRKNLEIHSLAVERKKRRRSVWNPSQKVIDRHRWYRRRLNDAVRTSAVEKLSMRLGKGAQRGIVENVERERARVGSGDSDVQAFIFRPEVPNLFAEQWLRLDADSATAGTIECKRIVHSNWVVCTHIKIERSLHSDPTKHVRDNKILASSREADIAKWKSHLSQKLQFIPNAMQELHAEHHTSFAGCCVQVFRLPIGRRTAGGGATTLMREGA